MIKLIEILLLSVAASGIAATVLRVALKYNLHHWYELNKRSWMPDTCFLCVGFWLCCLFAFLINLYFTGELLSVINCGLCGLIGAGGTAKLLE
jgi:hypothetical protein